MNKKMVLGGLAAAALVAPLAAGPASAYDGEPFLTDGGLPAVGGLLADAGANTDFNLAVPGLFGNYANRDLGSMYDPGRYTVGLNPANLHEFWADWSGNTTPTLFVNGYTDQTHQLVWGKQVAVTPCEVAGSSVTFTFTANAANIVNPAYASEFDNGALLTVEIDGAVLGSATTGGHSSTDVITITGQVPVSGNTLDIAIYNDSTVYSGNDFGISNLGLVQVGECTPPVVGGLTIGWYKNHTVDAADWANAYAENSVLFAGLNTWDKALTLLNTAPGTGKANDGLVQMRHQAIAFAMNVETIDGFADNVVGGMSAVEYLDYLNSDPTLWDTKAERIAINVILDAANQHAVV